MNKETNQSNYFNLTTDAIGYVNRRRLVKTNGGQSYLCCDVVALVGPSNETRNVRFDCIVTGEAAIADMYAIDDAVAELEDPKIFVSVRLADLKAEIFTYQKGDKQGQAGVSLKARLIKLNSCSIDGQNFELPSAVAKEEEALPPAPAPQPPSPPAASSQPKRGVYPAVPPRNAAPQKNEALPQPPAPKRPSAHQAASPQPKREFGVSSQRQH